MRFIDLSLFTRNSLIGINFLNPPYLSLVDPRLLLGSSITCSIRHRFRGFQFGSRELIFKVRKLFFFCYPWNVLWLFCSISEVIDSLLTNVKTKLRDHQPLHSVLAIYEFCSQFYYFSGNFSERKTLLQH